MDVVLVVVEGELGGGEVVVMVNNNNNGNLNETKRLTAL